MAEEKPIVLITGAGGRIGSAIRSVLDDTFTVVGFELQCKDLPDCIEVDITSEDSLARAFAGLRRRYGSRIASVIHLAAYFDFTGEPDPKYEQVNVQGSERLLRALQSFEVEQFVYSSTMLVHAPTRPGVKIDERSPLGPKWPYPESKAAAERAVLACHGAIPAVILRIAGVYTDQCDVPSLANQIQRIYERSALSRAFPGDLTHGQAFVHLDDLVQAVRRVVERRAAFPAEETLLIGEPVSESYGDLQDLIGRLIHGESWKTVDIPKSVAAAGAWLQDKAEVVIPDAIDRGVEPFIKPFMVKLADDHYELDIGRAVQRLDWRPRHRLRDRLPVIIEALKRDPAAWYRANRLPLPLWLEGGEGEPAPAGAVLAKAQSEEGREHRRTLWCHLANAGLGLWLASSPFTLGLAEGWLSPAEPITPSARGIVHSDSWMTASDTAAGLLIVVFALLSMIRDFGWARWVTAGIGIWLLFAPMVFWTPSAAAYANDSLVGALVVVFAVAVPPAPGVSPLARVSGPDVPPGWDWNPSAPGARVIIVTLAFVGLFVSRHLAAYQLGHVESAWDPFFGEGTERIVTSRASEVWPVSDAALGATVYLMEILIGVTGDRRRWRTMPWLVLLFGVLIVPLGGVSIFFIIIQPVLIGTWCTLCLLAAAAMLLQIPYALNEMLATLQFLKDRRRKGRPLWHVLFRGDTLEGGRAERPEEIESAVFSGKTLAQGINVPWNLAICTLIGIALMFTRLFFGTAGAAANSDHIVGSLVITFSVIALGEVARPVRMLNVPLGLWLLLSPWMLEGYSGAAAVASVLAGLLLMGLCVRRGAVRGQYGAWDKVIRRRDPSGQPHWRAQG
jgi:nucleoside-diphosphate-sugar epimerase